MDSTKSGLMKSSWSLFEGGFKEKWSYGEFMEPVCKWIQRKMVLWRVHGARL
ncbi:hypothetical protein [Mesobacillus maritimus]|uniref:hypothetical protein n=1 Tax=Mesobacillus maritimus TaxID=1643336 RepID=UPI00384BD567